MSSSATLASSLSVGFVCEEPVPLQTLAVQTAGELKQSFADTPALVRVREESRADNTLSGSTSEEIGTVREETVTSGSDSADSATGESRPRQKAGKKAELPDTGRQTRDTEAMIQAAAQQVTVRPVQPEPDHEAAQIATRGKPAQAGPGREPMLSHQTVGHGDQVLSGMQPPIEKGLKEPASLTATTRETVPDRGVADVTTKLAGSVERATGRLARADSRVSLGEVNAKGPETDTARTPPAGGGEAAAPRPTQIGVTAQHSAETVAQQAEEGPTKGQVLAFGRRLPPGYAENTQAQRQESAVEAPPVFEEKAGNSRSNGRPSSAEAGEAVKLRETVNGGPARTAARDADLPLLHGKGSSAPVESFAAATSEPSAAPERLLWQSSLPPTTESRAVGSPTQSISEQMLDSMQASFSRGDRQLLIRLEPPELGSVLVRFREEGEQIHGVLEVGKNDTRYEIERALPEVMRNLQESGIQIRRLDVTVADQGDKGLGREQLQRDAWSQQGGTDEFTGHPQRSSGSRWTLDGGEPQGGNDSPPSSAHLLSEVSDRIDMLV